MPDQQPLTVVAALVALLALMPLVARAADRPDPAILLHPSMEWEAADVVRIVVAALADNDNPFPDAGIATTFNFASPANRRVTGPLARFARMVKAEPYALMVGHVASDFSDIAHDGDQALQLVQLSGADGRAIVYAFRLSKQVGGQYDGMWMTDAVWPVANDLAPQRAL